MQFSPTLCESPNTKFTEGLATRLLCLMVEGNTLTEACREIGVSRFQVWQCRQADKEFDCAYESAHRAMAAALVDASLTELKNADRETWQKASAYAQRCAWMGSKLLPKLYGDKPAETQITQSISRPRN